MEEYDKGLNLVIKVIDGVKTLYTESTDFPTNGSLHGMPVIKGKSITASNWQKPIITFWVQLYRIKRKFV